MKRSQKKLEKLKKNFDRRRELYHLMKQYGDDIMRSDNFKSTRNYVQHGTIPVRRHCLDVAQHSLAINRKLRIHCQEKDLVRGALLHDYFLYDWHEKSDDHRLHGFTHPARALKNAEEIFDLSVVEKDIIKRHMFPLTPVPPAYRESYLVCLADKICSSYETLHRDRVDWLLYHLQSRAAKVK